MEHIHATTNESRLSDKVSFFSQHFQDCIYWPFENTSVLRFLSTLWPILQVIAHHIQDKLAVSFDSSSIGLISDEWFLTIDAKYSSVKTYNEDDSSFLEKKMPFQNILNRSSACTRVVNLGTTTKLC